ncbi:MAG: hypothetical protein A3G34_02140 [Candidatus Lindowbacteria bacterium RIFCSPLOWO2_12_FULL_62_27]|nr:MAG: hypothetical protein A3G34_02140 [Candidatus Lindowbacteria bacterium RIFCSPLOWO2_12_FULL_62_27]OGH61233.1 MAG: hypothetical protein A3I06_15650 [Candidatus Lindowbacteria bacterium RIFCSPLOWO2_02_FULL_62_12]
MKTLVVHPGDPSTEFLAGIYAGRNWMVARQADALTETALRAAMARHARVILLGHGSPDGLFDYRMGDFAVDKRLVPDLREKICVCIWCHADQFVRAHKLQSPFHTGMFISDPAEARLYGVRATARQIQVSNRRFGEIAGEHLDCGGRSMIVEAYRGLNTVAAFNAARMFST